ncbi:hypothetical protein [Nodularia sphaerocarpa]|uniref:hypothetical protein n=1 Tax=Nodularia sphaerocarpa TaxID=137816 RepID=UPI001EFB2339|nr:hypothetical protein [Nodularia sphaerocarpa]MDB9374303.1 hypothetical protein [Nodularia sphaerocarpa CS-585]MDB9377678.1 hypothetical protein [Nodularia sphaerocarpa CS-585A2]ULP74139.1 hypothetical protein BDGGKGIB_03802 [Nodularia sphaerocarpa UHCC 0038]
MAEPTITQLFGAGASQTSSAITIQKADLAGVGLSASANNTAESLLTAINLKAQQHLTQTNLDGNIDQSIVVEPGFSSFTTRGENNNSYRIDQITLNLYKPDSGSIIDPDDY